MEVLMVVAIIGVAAGFAITTLQPGVTEQLEAVGDVVVADLDYARSLAVTGASRYRITFDASGDSYGLRHSGTNSLLDVLPRNPLTSPDDPPDEQIFDLTELPLMGPAVRVFAVQSGTAAASPATLEFGPLGETTRDQTTTIWLQCGRQQVRRYLPLTVNPVTGLVSRGEIQTTPPALTASFD